MAPFYHFFKYEKSEVYILSGNAFGTYSEFFSSSPDYCDVSCTLKTVSQCNVLLTCFLSLAWSDRR